MSLRQKRSSGIILIVNPYFTSRHFLFDGGAPDQILENTEALTIKFRRSAIHYSGTN